MFQSARVNQPIYILYKEAVPRLEIGSITQVTQPMVKFPTIPQYGQPQEHVVDVHANVGGAQRQFQQLSANKETADFGAGNVFVSINRDAMNAEIENLKKASEEHLRRVDEERQKIVKYDEILMQLNPEFAEKQRQEQEIATLKNQVAQLAQTNSNLESMMARLMDKLDGDGSKSTKTK
ncbi:hypothetical protein [uncultured Alistipes sp.]|uniref:hypothetical protein n=1 Tax=uncultured Alistipes sp. TaxID=538949 RepID=UPI002635AFE1|nr:hypothetical protein [uncultured Alistipes sp.]